MCTDRGSGLHSAGVYRTPLDIPPDTPPSDTQPHGYPTPKGTWHQRYPTPWKGHGISDQEETYY